MNKYSILILCMMLFVAISTGCIDDDPVAYNQYSIANITPPVDKGSNNEKKVYIGHDLPVNIELTASYDEEDIPIQFYLLNSDDIEEVENGIGYISDIRMYYCDRTQNTTIAQIQAGTHTYGLVINIPAEDSRDELTGDFKTGNFYIVAEVNKYEDAEIDAYAVYQKFKDRLDAENKVEIASDYMNKPDLSVESLNFTGGEDDPKDVIAWYNVVLNTLPGGEDLPTIIVRPSEKDRTFTGTVHIKSSSSDALNVPLEIYVGNEAGTFSIPCRIYDRSMGGWVKTYYLPNMKANTTERVTLTFQIPDDPGPLNYFSDYGNWEAAVIANGIEYMIQYYPLSALRHEMGEEEYGDHNFKIRAVINSSGSITESRFIQPNSDNNEYTDSDYCEQGNCDTISNNTLSQDLTFNLERIEVEANQGINVYPWCKISAPEPEDKVIVIFWDGFELNVGDNTFGATAEAHEGMFFYNYSLYSLGFDIHGTVFGTSLYLVNTFLDAESHPNNPGRSGYEIHIEGGTKVALSEAGEGFSQNTWEYPVLLWSKEYSKDFWYLCFKFNLTAGIETWFIPGINLDINTDGSMTMDKYANLKASVYADASASIAGLASIGLYTYIDVITLQFIQSCYTETEYGQGEYVGTIKGTLNRKAGLYLIGPKGYIDLYFEIDFIFFTKRWSKEIFRFTSFNVPIFEADFAGSGTSTWWVRVEDMNLLDYSTPEKSGI